MPEILEKDLDKFSIDKSGQKIWELSDKPGIWTGAFTPGRFFTNRREAYWANVRESDSKKLKDSGLNENAQTPQQEREFQAKIKESEELKKKADLATELAMQTKSGLKVR